MPLKDALSQSLLTPFGTWGVHLSTTPHKVLRFFSCTTGRPEGAPAPLGFIQRYAELLSIQDDMEHLEIWPGVALGYQQGHFFLQPLSGPLVGVGSPAQHAVLQAIPSQHPFDRPFKGWKDLTHHEQIAYTVDLGDQAVELTLQHPQPSLVQNQGLRAWCVPPQKASPMLCAIRKT